MDHARYIPLVMLDTLSGEYIALIRALDDQGIDYVKRDCIREGSRVQQSAIEILVESSEHNRAQKLLQSVDETLATALPSFCPACDGESIIVRIRLGFLGLMQREMFHCQGCGYEWPRYVKQ